MLLTTKLTTAFARAFQLLLRWRPFQALLIILIFLNLLALRPHQPSPHALESKVEAESSNLVFSPDVVQKIGRVFVTALLKNNEDILKAGWSDAVVGLARALGPNNVWVSIHESGSVDGTKKELRELQSRLTALGAQHEINMADIGEDIHKMIIEDGPGWISWKGRRMIRRIPWLAELRNMNLGALTALTARNVTFDKILFLNDIIFTADDALDLLLTRDGEYAAACGFDYSRSYPTATFYDQFATRDSNGKPVETLYHPYFADGESREVLQKGLPVPVKSCWSGLAAFDATPFQDPTHPLRFRAINDTLAQSFVEASECCLVHYDNPLSASKGVWMNPDVRVAYSRARYDAVHPPSGWPSPAAITFGRFFFWFTTVLKENARHAEVIDRRYKAWTQKSKLNMEIGSDCLSKQMMVISEKGKWKEIKE